MEKSLSGRLKGLKRQAVKTQYHSYRMGDLPKGCSECVKGRKLVLFITGLCGTGCFYCPLSDQKKDKDVIFANEWDVRFPGGTHKRLDKATERIIFREAELCEANGAGITGGDPLVVLDRTVHVIRLLKKRFGKDFHIHLYTSLTLVDEKKLQVLAEAGLDEIRFHPGLCDNRLWNRIALARKFSWDVGVEIPAVPGRLRETRRLIDAVGQYIDFLNLNELEISDTNSCDLVERGYYPKDRISYGVAGSESVALRLMEYCKDKAFSIHYCTCRLKDRVQLARRLKIRAKNARLKTDRVTGEGMLIRGAIYLPGTTPSFKGDAASDGPAIIRRLRKAKSTLHDKGIETTLDTVKMRLLTSEKEVRRNEKLIKQSGLIPAVIEEYPTSDAMPIEIDFI